MHVIRLRGFWQTDAAADGRHCHTRRFGRPTSLGVNECVWLTGELPEAGEFFLNGTRLGNADAGVPFAFDITSLLHPRNELTLASSLAAMDCELHVEIRAKA